jgi:hypothetical protein
MQVGRKPISFCAVTHHSTTAPHLQESKMKFFYIYTSILPNFTDYVIFRTNDHKRVENALSHMLLKLIIVSVMIFSTILRYTRKRLHQSSIIFCFSVFLTVQDKKMSFALLYLKKNSQLDQGQYARAWVSCPAAPPPPMTRLRRAVLTATPPVLPADLSYPPSLTEQSAE